MKLFSAQKFSLLLLCMTILSQGCVFRKKRDDSRNQSLVLAPEISHEEWLEKVSQTLRNGASLTDEEFEAYVDKTDDASKEEFVAKMMEDPRFAETLLKFGLFYFNRAANRIKTAASMPGMFNYDENVYAMPSVLAAAAAIAKDPNGDFFGEILNPRPSIYFAPLVVTDEAAYQVLIDKFKAALQEALAPVKDPGPDDDNNGANAIATACGNGGNMMYEWYYRQQGANLKALFGDRLGMQLGNEWLVKTFSSVDCAGIFIQGENGAESRFAYKTTPAKLRAKLTSIDLAATKIIEQLRPLHRTTAGVKGLFELTRFDSAGIANADELSTAFTLEGFWKSLRNSSTNRNRKRAAYIFRTFLCEDLTPLDIDISGGAGETAHASSPACQGCHYKLDPMGGIFRYIGANGASFVGQDALIFDDDAIVQGDAYKDYLKGWAPNGHEQIGVYKAKDTPHPGWQSTVVEVPKEDDLGKLMYFLRRNSPEAKQCIARRMAEFFISNKQVYDGGWLGDLTAYIDSGEGSGEFLRLGITRLMMSNSFKRRENQLNQCYDFAENATIGSTPPCDISLVIENNCVRCHNGSFVPNSKITYVNFGKWVDFPDGGKGFEHYELVNGVKKLRDRRSSLEEIRERINSSDSKRRMPTVGAMSLNDRSGFTKWLDGQLSQ